MRIVTLVRSFTIAVLALTSFALQAPMVRAQCCVVPNIGGTAQLPPACVGGYTGPAVGLNGLPPGEPVLQGPTLRGFFNVVEVPGGILGGTHQTWNATLVLHLVGQFPFIYDRTLNLPAQGASDAAPRVLAAPLQSFTTELIQLQAQLPIGDPDFDLLRITAGRGFGMPSPGHTTLTSQAGGWDVDSFFDITYRLDYIGAQSGPFAGTSNAQTELAQRFNMCHLRPTGTQVSTWGALKLSYR